LKRFRPLEAAGICFLSDAAALASAGPNLRTKRGKPLNISLTVYYQSTFFQTRNLWKLFAVNHHINSTRMTWLAPSIELARDPGGN
jgi:hypothetical protein